MPFKKLLTIICTSLLYGCITPSSTLNYCGGSKYIEKTKKVFLTDENLEATMTQVINIKNQKQAWGYFKRAIRNDTNFIYSKVQRNNDSIVITTYHKFMITKNIDSTIALFTCTKNGILFHSQKTYYNGKIINYEKFDRIMDSN